MSIDCYEMLLLGEKTVAANYDLISYNRMACFIWLQNVVINFRCCKHIDRHFCSYKGTVQQFFMAYQEYFILSQAN